MTLTQQQDPFTQPDETTTLNQVVRGYLIRWDQLSEDDIYDIADAADTLADLLVKAGLSPSGFTPVSWIDQLHNIACEIHAERTRARAHRIATFLIDDNDTPTEGDE